MYPTTYNNNTYYQTINNINKKWTYKEARDYDDFDSIVEMFPHLSQINSSNPDVILNKNKIGLIIRSANDDNVHKAIKYGIWTTTPKNKSKLQQLWKKHQQNGIQIYLFFSVVKSGMFQGVARLQSSYFQQTFPFWWQNHSGKFKGYFKIQWIYIKDVNYKHFQNLYSVEGQQVIKSKDCDLIDLETTNQMLNIYQKRPLKRYIFNDFDKMDDREKNYTRKIYQWVLQQNQSQQQQYYTMGSGGYNGFKQQQQVGGYGGYENQGGSNGMGQYGVNGSLGTGANLYNQGKGQNYNQQSQQQQIYTPVVPNIATDTSYTNIGTNPNMIPAQMMRPSHLNPTVNTNVNSNMPSNMPVGGGFLGFQMNPVSKNRKK